jgi:hypothetical protein
MYSNKINSLNKLIKFNSWPKVSVFLTNKASVYRRYFIVKRLNASLMQQYK